MTKKYHRLAALGHVNLEVEEGAIYALVGQNGAGKTTAIKVLMNLISASQGSAEVLGTDSRNLRGKLYGQIGYVSENQEIPEWMKVGALLEYLREFYSTWDTALEQSLVKQFDLPLDRKIKALSRGVRMKLSLAGALAFHPRLIVLDEPFGGLDPLVRDQLIERLLERATESTVFLSSHDLAEIESFASHVGYLESGLLLGAGIAWLSTKMPDGEMEYPPAVVEHLQEGVILGALIAVPVWQFARRNRWASCATFLGVLVLYVLISVAPFGRTPDMIYPLVESATAPAQISVQLPELTPAAKCMALCNR